MQGGLSQWNSDGLPSAAGAEGDESEQEQEPRAGTGSALRLPALPAFAKRR